ncbi:MAG: Flp family type IVb pilin [Terracidiphilus sp.]
MHKLMLKVHFKLHSLMAGEEGQDLVEYALIVALMAFGCVAGMQSLASGVNLAFNSVSSELVDSL